ncbi:zinc carboxypeptidase [Rhodopseudomonas palustris]|uniref:Uncharacterized protein n=1 Tax=Rhodopseudomonas palustris (strain DX-1) TaxID=652103 RepID=E6VEQ1_RHOPX|nr:hypothetical protein [Rhodopseudomonas palustris]QDL96765.1 zinc carboxypeptidase [Rhodopseudomonas palustris]
MSGQDDAWLRHQQKRWLNPNGDRWVRQDVSRFLARDMDPVQAFPALAFKYSPNQPRVPAGNPDGGQWTRDGGGWRSPSELGNIRNAARVGGVAGPEASREYPGLFGIAAQRRIRTGVLLAGDLPVGSDPDPGTPTEQPPEIPQTKPSRSAERTTYFRAAADWLARNAGLAGALYEGSMRSVEWLRDWNDVILAARDTPKPLQELMNGVGQARPGYDVHHINEVTAAKLDGYSWAQINDPSNLVSIPRLKHYQITGWYSARSTEFDGLSPRKFLRGKDWETRRKVGLRALRMFGVLEP